MKRIFVLFFLLPAFFTARSQEILPAAVQIPDRSVSLLDYGGVGDGVSSNTEAFRKAVAALSKQGGGHLIVPEGIFLTGPVVLKDCIDLHLERGAVILLSPDKRDFLEKGKIRPGISASKRHDVSITGAGIIDGNGAWWRPIKRSKVSDVEWKEFLKMGGTVTEDGSLWYAHGLKHFPDLVPSYLEQEKMRTHLVRFTDCTRVLVSGVTIQNAPKFHLVPSHCTDVTIDGVTVRCPWNAQNGDGIDIMQSQRVIVRGCTVDVGDDGICLKAGAGAKSLEDGPCKDILIENNTVYHAHGGFVIGSEFSAGMENIIVRHNTFCGTDTGLRFKSAPERGGKTKNIVISDIYMTDIKDEAVVFQTDYADRPAGYDSNQPATTQNFLPEFTDIRMSRIVCRGCATAVRAKGPLTAVHDITIKDAVFFYNERACDIDDPAMIRFNEVRYHTFDEKTQLTK